MKSSEVLKSQKDLNNLRLHLRRKSLLWNPGCLGNFRFLNRFN